jgi:hypothetical protein
MTVLSRAQPSEQSNQQAPATVNGLRITAETPPRKVYRCVEPCFGGDPCEFERPPSKGYRCRRPDNKFMCRPRVVEVLV